MVVEMKKLYMQFLSETYIASEEGTNKEVVGRSGKEEKDKDRNREMERIGFCVP